jgi:hypothetical protein
MLVNKPGVVEFFTTRLAEMLGIGTNPVVTMQT